MTTYQLAPYLLSVKPIRSEGDIRPINDIDARGTTLIDIVARTLTGAIGSAPFRIPNNDDVAYKISDVRVGANAIFYVVTHGSSGIESKITGPDDDEFERTTKHIEDIEFRNLVLFPANASYALLMTERIGGRGIAAFNAKLLKDTIQANIEGSLFTHAPLATAADMAAIPLMFNAVNFEFPKKTDPEGRFIDMSRLDGFFALNFRFRKARPLSNFADEDGNLDVNKIFGIINPSLEAAGVRTTGKKLKKIGVKAKMNVTLPSGNSRTFTLGVQEGPALVYPLTKGVPTPNQVDDDGQPVLQEEIERPEDSDFTRVAKDIVSDVKGNFTIPASAVSDCVLPDAHDPIEVPPTWKVVWNVPDHTVTDTP